MGQLRIAACQINTCVGDLDGNVERILAAYEQAVAAGADVAVFPELAVTGYPPEDLLLKPGFVADNRAALDRFAAVTTGGCVAVVGFVDVGRDLTNAAAVCAGGEVRGIYAKCDLPNSGPFDELRYFAPGRRPDAIYRIAGVGVGISICEDAWNPAGPIADQADSGAEVVININASPYAEGKLARRERMLATRAADASAALVYVNQVGGQDELIFDGGSMAFSAEGALIARAPQFVEDVLLVDVPVGSVYRKRLLDPRGRPVDAQLRLVEVAPVPVTGGPPAHDDAPVAATLAPALDPDSEVWEALVLGTRDYVAKNAFTDVVVGLSGGIDSSIVAVLAVDALGPGRVHTVAMPSRYSSDHSLSDAEKLAANLGIDHRTIPIEAAHGAMLVMLDPSFAGRDADLTEENLQSRIRGQVLMALSNKFGWLVLATGNKSELAVGYSTLYGDTCGGYALIKDVLKTRVFELARARNQRAATDLVPQSVLAKPPSAELRPDQRDDQSLPPYDVLDPILHAYVEKDRTAAEIIEAGGDPDVVRRITRLVDGAEYKRRQSPPGPRVTDKAFGKDRRLPITNAYRG